MSKPSRIACTLAAVCLLLLAALTQAGLAAEKDKQPKVPQKASQLFKETHLWTLHLHFTPQEWEAMEPKGGFGRFGGGRPGGPGGPGGGRGGGFGPAMFLAPLFLQQGDLNHDGKLSADEFRALGQTWFVQWDKDKTGKVNPDQLRAALTTIPGMPAGGGRGGPNLQGAEGKRNGVAGAAGIEFKFVHADLEIAGKTLKDVGIRYKGNGTWMQSQGQLKRSMKIELNHFEKGQKLAGITKLNLHSNVTDASWMNEVMSHQLYRDAGIPAPRTAYARVYLTVPGKYDHQYVGLYSIVEDVDKHFAQENYKEKGGAMFKPVTPNLFADLGDDWAAYRQSYDPKQDLSDEQIKRVIGFSKLVTHADDAQFAAHVGEYLDLDEFSRYMAVTVWLSTLDSILAMGQNFYVYLDPKTNQFQFLPWDLDHSFGQFPMGGSQEQREQLSIQHPWRGEIRFLERVFKVEAFKKLYLAHLAEYDATIFKPERFAKQVDQIAAAIRPAVADESPEKVERFDKVVAGEAVAPMFGRGGGGGPFGQGVKPIKGFVTARSESVHEQLTGKSEGLALEQRGPGGRGGPGGMRGPGDMLAGVFMNALDANHDGQLTRDEVTQGFARWFAAWDAQKTGALTDEQLRAGIEQDLMPGRGERFGRFGGGFGGGGGRRLGGPGFDGPPGGGPPGIAPPAPPER